MTEQHDKATAATDERASMRRRIAAIIQRLDLIEQEYDRRESFTAAQGAALSSAAAGRTNTAH